MIRLLWALSAQARYYLRRYMPTNIALDAIRTAITTGELAEHTVYSAAGLAKQLGMSLSPVREAMMSLVAEGTVEPAGVGVDEGLVLVEPQSVLGFPGARGAQAVPGALADPGDEAVVHAGGLRGQSEALFGARPRLVGLDQAHPDVGGARGVHGEVHAAGLRGGAEGVRGAGGGGAVVCGHGDHPANRGRSRAAGW